MAKSDQEFPVRWRAPHFKGGAVLAKVQRHMKRRQTAKVEKDFKAIVRARDRYCRFPGCGCGIFRLQLEVCHLVHKGIGGDVTGDRSAPEKMILLCAARHRAHRVSLDKGTLRITPLTERGTAGPCRFEVDMRAMRIDTVRPAWLEIGVETSLHQCEPAPGGVRSLRSRLAEMTS